MSISQQSVFHPLHLPSSVPTEKQDIIARKEPITKLILQPLPENDILTDKTDSGSMNLEDKNLDISLSNSSIYADSDNVIQSSNKGGSDGQYVEVEIREVGLSRSLNYQLDNSGDYIESVKTTGAFSSDLDTHQELTVTTNHSGTGGYYEHDSEDEVADSRHLKSTVSSQTTEETGGNPVDLDEINEDETYKQLVTDFNESQDTQAVVFEFGDGSDLQLSFDIDPYLLITTSKCSDYLFAHEDRKNFDGTARNLDYVFSGDKYIDTSQIMDGDVFDLYNDTTLESGNMIFDEHRSSSSFPYLPYSSDVMSTLSFLTSSSDTSGISASSGYISSESSHYFDSHLTKLVNFVPPTLPFVSFLDEEIPIYTSY